MTVNEMQLLKKEDPGYLEAVQRIREQEKRKTAQYIGEGVVFLLVIMTVAFIIFRAVRKQLKLGHQQQHLMMAITHELKTPVAVIRLNLETLQKRKLDEQQQQRFLQNTLQEANRLNDLCSNILLSSQIEAGGYQVTKEITNLSELVKSCTQDFITRFPHRTIQYTIPKDLFIEGDKLLLHLAVNNLIDNAIKYSPKEKPVNISLEENGKQVSLLVADQGKGIEEEEKKKIFEKYYRTGNMATKEAKGTGLGLYLTKKIARQHNAVITVKDNAPTGSIFAIRFQLTSS